MPDFQMNAYKDFENISHSLPNGFHDSYLSDINIDFKNKILSFNLSVDFSDSSESSQPIYKMACMEIRNWVAFIIDGPYSGFLFSSKQQNGDISVDGEAGWAPQLKEKLKSNFDGKIDIQPAFWFFLREMNVFVQVIGGNYFFAVQP
jgi:hypothetical protein